MDNFFEILIYLFIIVSFLSSIFKKKKKPVPQKPESPEPQQREKVDISYSPEQEMESASVKSSSTDEYDILKELEQFFKVGDTQQKPAPKQQPAAQPKSVEHKQKTVEDSWRTRTESEHKYESIWEKKSRDVNLRKKNIDSQTTLQASKFEELLKDKKTTYSTAFERSIKKQLKNPASLKEYIVISEILGKPKALKHR